MNEILRLAEMIESFRRKNHYCVEEDCWYSCPAHEDYCGESPPVCFCGFLEHNAKVDQALKIVRGLTLHEPDKGVRAGVQLEVA